MTGVLLGPLASLMLGHLLGSSFFLLGIGLEAVDFFLDFGQLSLDGPYSVVLLAEDFDLLGQALDDLNNVVALDGEVGDQLIKDKQYQKGGCLVGQLDAKNFNHNWLAALTAKLFTTMVRKGPLSLALAGTLWGTRNVGGLIWGTLRLGHY